MKGLILLLIPFVLFLFGLYVKYRLHIQFALLIRRGYKYFSKKKDNGNDRR